MKREKWLFSAITFSIVCVSIAFVFGMGTYTPIDFTDNHLVIPSVGICENFVITELTQDSVNSNNIVCNVSRFGYDNPVICGHNYKALKNLHKTSVGDSIYLYLNSHYSKYIVTVSEAAVIINDGYDFQGVSGLKFLADDFGPALRIYTCHGDNRWIVVAKPAAN